MSRRIFSRIFSPDFFSSFCGKKCPEKSSRKIPGKILQNLYNKNPPTHFCRLAGATFRDSRNSLERYENSLGGFSANRLAIRVIPCRRPTMSQLLLIIRMFQIFADMLQNVLVSLRPKRGKKSLFSHFLINSVHTRCIVKTSGFTRGVCKSPGFY